MCGPVCKILYSIQCAACKDLEFVLETLKSVLAMMYDQYTTGDINEALARARPLNDGEAVIVIADAILTVRTEKRDVHATDRSLDILKRAVAKFEDP